MEPWRRPVERWSAPGVALEEMAVGLYQALLDIHAAGVDFLYTVRTWVLEIAPVIIAAHAKQALRDVVREFPLVSATVKEETLQWLREIGL